MPDGEQNALFWQPDKGRPWAKIIAAVVVVGIVGGGIYLATSGDEESQAQPDPGPSARVAAPHPGESQAPATPKPKAAPPAAPSPKASAAAPPPRPAPPAPAPEATRDVSQCVAKHFAADAFANKVPNFEFVCEQRDPRRTAMNLKSRLVYAQPKGGPVSDAMKEWSILHWYEFAFASLVAHACCAEPPELDTKSKTCDFSEKITAVGKAGAAGKGLEEAMKEYDGAVQCLMNFGLSAHYKQKHPTYGPERDVIKRVSERSVK